MSVTPTNQFREAITIQSQALNLALTKTARSTISQRLEQYRMGNPTNEEKGLVRCGFNPSDHADLSHADPVDPSGR